MIKIKTNTLLTALNRVAPFNPENISLQVLEYSLYLNAGLTPIHSLFIGNTKQNNQIQSLYYNELRDAVETITSKSMFIKNACVFSDNKSFNCRAKGIAPVFQEPYTNTNVHMVLVQPEIITFISSNKTHEITLQYDNDTVITRCCNDTMIYNNYTPFQGIVNVLIPSHISHIISESNNMVLFLDIENGVLQDYSIQYENNYISNITGTSIHKLT